MSFRLEITEAAVEQVFEEETYYESKKVGLGAKFLDELFACYVNLEKSPKQWAEVRPSIRRALVNRFPYSVFFRIVESRSLVQVLLVIHQSADPRKWP